MRRIRAALAVLTIMLFSLLVAGPASAGGPTSVLLVSGTGQTASLHTSQADYAELAEEVGASEGSSVNGAAAPAGAGHDVGPAVTLTWLIHDVQVWRVDRIYFDAVGGPWISTLSVVGEGNIYDSPIVWHVAERGKVLEALLNKLGVSPYPSGNGSTDSPRGSSVDLGAGTNVAAPVATAAAASRQSTIERAAAWIPGTAGLMWGIGGLALGIALTVAGMRLFPKPRPAPGELAIAEPAHDGPPDVVTAPLRPDIELNRTSTDDLSLPSYWR